MIIRLSRWLRRLAYTSAACMLLAVVSITPYSRAETAPADAVQTTQISQESPVSDTTANYDSGIVPDNSNPETSTTNAASSEQVIQATSDQTASTGTVDMQQNDDIAHTQTGDATNDSNITNISNVYQNVSGNTPVVLISTVDGNQTGNIVVDPYALGMPRPTAETVSTTLDPTTEIVVHNLLLTDVSQMSSSGDILLASNDDVASVATGDSSNTVDMINVANTVIGTGSFFVGIINIFGDFQGNILLPSELLMQSTAQHTNNLPSASVLTDATVSNNILMNAQSGSISAEGNDDIGALQTGSVSNSLLARNYTGQYILYENAFLILVQMGGQWFGYIYQNPYVSGALAERDTATTTDSSHTSSSPATTPPSINVYATTSIDNNLAMSAYSGDIGLYGNDDIGTATTGNASNAARILNVANTFVSFSNWFGVLIVNVLGNWFGTVQAVPTAEAEQMSSTTTPDAVPPALSVGSTASSSVRYLVWDIPAYDLYGFTEWLGLSETTASDPTLSFVAASSDADEGLPLTGGFNVAAAPETSALRWITLALFMTASLYSGHRLYALRQLG